MTWAQPPVSPAADNDWKDRGNRRAAATLADGVQQRHPVEEPYYWRVVILHPEDQGHPSKEWRIGLALWRRRRGWFDKFLWSVAAAPDVDDARLLQLLTTDRDVLDERLDVVAVDLIRKLDLTVALDRALDEEGQR